MTGPEVKVLFDKLTADYSGTIDNLDSSVARLEEIRREARTTYWDACGKLRAACHDHISDGGPIMNQKCIYCGTYMG